jgi:hypothetical protein
MNVGGGASTLAFTQQPVNTAAGSAMNATVKLTDGAGNPLAGVSVTLTVPDNSAALIGATSGAGTLSGTVVQTTDNSGTAIFGELSIDLAGTKQLRAIAEQYAPVISNSFQVTPGSAATVAVISGSPQATVASQLLPSLLQVKVTDAKGNPQAARRLRLHFRLPDLAGSFPALPPCLRMPTACYRTPVDRKQHPGEFHCNRDRARRRRKMRPSTLLCCRMQPARCRRCLLRSLSQARSVSRRRLPRPYRL